MNGVQARKILSFVLLPQVIPRARKLFSSGFGYVAFLMASIYGAVRLLPAGHPYLDPRNINKYGIRHVIGEAANNLVLKKENIDQILIFAALLAGVVILFLQLVLMVYGFMFKPAMAGMAASLFQTPDPSVGANATDMAFIVLYQVFGIPSLFCTEGGICTVDDTGALWPFHIAFHELLRFYSLGLLIVGVVIFLYYVVVVVGETATTGHPFGQRFQNVWVPIRLVVALGLLIPINYGLNSGQYIVLYAAKFGSGFATNGWIQFNQTLSASSVFPGGVGSNPLGERESLLLQPNAPSMMSVVQMMTMVHACAYAYWKLDPAIASTSATPPNNTFYIQPYLVKQVQPWMTNTNTRQVISSYGAISYVDALDFYNDSDIVIRFGRYDPTSTEWDSQKGKVAPLCGDVRIPISYLRTRGQGGTYGGPDQMQEWYYNKVLEMWFNGGLVQDLAQRYMELAINTAPHNQCSIGCGRPELPACGGAPPPCESQQPTGLARQRVVDTYDAQLKAAITSARTNFINNSANDFQIQPEVLDRGWAGAGIWYNMIADINGAFITSIMNQPSFEAYPLVMEQVREDRRKNDPDVSTLTQFNPNLSDGRPVDGVTVKPKPLEIAKLLNDFFLWWNRDDPNALKGGSTVGNGPALDAIRSIFGFRGLAAIRGENAGVHPLALLAGTGKLLVDSSIIFVGASAITGSLGGFMRNFKDIANGAILVEIASGISMAFGMMALTAGFILFYVLPFLPFLYFFFAFGTWIKSIFEAMVGVPLWALAHLRLDGEGLPGDSASSGYFLIFEIFVRPILTVFGLIGAVLVLTAQVRMLNVLWDLVTSNLTGYEGHTDVGGTQKFITFAGFKVLPRNELDQFFYTIVYTIIVYMMAVGSFKMIDKIPDQILRFMGAGVSAFSDINPDPTEGLTRYAAVGGYTLTSQAAQGMKSVASGVGSGVGGALKGLSDAVEKGY